MSRVQGDDPGHSDKSGSETGGVNEHVKGTDAGGDPEKGQPAGPQSSGNERGGGTTDTQPQKNVSGGLTAKSLKAGLVHPALEMVQAYQTTGDTKMAAEAMSALAENQLDIKKTINDHTRRLDEKMGWGLVLSVFVAGAFLIGIMLFGPGKGDIQSIEFARGLITLLFSVGTIMLMLMIVGSVLMRTDVDPKDRFAQCKDVLTVLIGIFGTIIGFYFGSQGREGTDRAGQVVAGGPATKGAANIPITAPPAAGTKEDAKAGGESPKSGGFSTSPSASPAEPKAPMKNASDTTKASGTTATVRP